MITRNHLLISTVLFGTLLAVQTPSASDLISISLTRTQISDTATFPAGKYLEFTPADTSYFVFPAGSKSWQTAKVFDEPGLPPVVLGRYQDSLGNWFLSFDANVDQNFANDSVITPRQVNGQLVYQLQLPIAKGPGAKDELCSFQLKMSPTTASIRRGEYRTGIVQLKTRNIPIRLYETALDSRSYSLTQGTTMLVDTTGHGVFSSGWKFARDGRLIPSERIDLRWPFVLAGQRLIARSIDSAGARLDLIEYPSDTAPAAGFVSPRWSAAGLNGESCSSNSLHGKVVLILLWSTTCPFCEKIRPAWNSFVDRSDTSQMQAIVCCNGNDDTTSVRAFLKSHPYKGLVAAYSPDLWRFDHGAGTPGYCVIDKSGVIRLIGSGSSFFAVVENLIPEILKK